MEEDRTEVCGSNLFLVCVDACNHSLRAFNWYLKYCHQAEHKLALVHVYTRPEMGATTYTPEMFNAVYADLLDEQLRKSAKITDKFQQLCNEKGLNAEVHKLVKAESIGQTIC